MFQIFKDPSGVLGLSLAFMFFFFFFSMICVLYFIISWFFFFFFFLMILGTSHTTNKYTYGNVDASDDRTDFCINTGEHTTFTQKLNKLLLRKKKKKKKKKNCYIR